MLVILMGLVAAMLWSGHPSPSGRMLRRALVERPAEWLSRLTLGRVGLTLVSLAAIAVAFHLFNGEGLKLAGASVGEAWVWFMAFDVGTYLEISAALWLLGAVRQAHAALDKVRGAVVRAADAIRHARRRRTGTASPRARRPTPRRPQDKSPDPEGWPGLALAA